MTNIVRQPRRQAAHGKHSNDARQQLDRTDLTLLRLLQEDSRMSNSALAQKVGLAPSTTLVRVRSLQERGIIKRFTIELDPSELGLGIQALIFVSLRAGARSQLTPFRERMEERQEVIQIMFLAGAEDFIIHVLVTSSEELKHFVLEHLSNDPVVAATRTSLIFHYVHRGIQM